MLNDMARHRPPPISGVDALELDFTTPDNATGAEASDSLVTTEVVDRAPIRTRWMAAVGLAAAGTALVAAALFGPGSNEPPDVASNSVDRLAQETSGLLQAGGHLPGDQWKVDLSPTIDVSPQRRFEQKDRLAATIDVASLPTGWRVEHRLHRGRRSDR